MNISAIIIGAGLAGCEAAWQLVQRGIAVEIHEMRPALMTKAHKTDKCAELVCSNSLKNNELSNAAGILKAEMRLLNSLVMEAAEISRVPAGAALAVDRHIFSEYIDNKIRNHPLITFKTGELTEIPESSDKRSVIIATGPLTSPALTKEIEKLTSSGNLYFFDAIAPILFHESLDLTVLYKMSRYGKGGDDYLNIPLNKEQYQNFITAVTAAEKYSGNELVENDSPEKLRLFEGCMPIEDMIARGPETLRFGPLKPKGLPEPSTGREPFAAIQLRQDDQLGQTWSMVGLQTRLKRHEQERILRSLPGLQNAEFVRYGSFHRNTFIESPKCLNATLEFRGKKNLFFAGQITGVEGYLESAIGGIVAGINAAKRLKSEEPIIFPVETATGALFNYITDSTRKDFQPMNITFGVMPSYFQFAETYRRNKDLQKKATADLALEKIRSFI